MAEFLDRIEKLVQRRRLLEQQIQDTFPVNEEEVISLYQQIKDEDKASIAEDVRGIIQGFKAENMEAKLPSGHKASLEELFTKIHVESHLSWHHKRVGNNFGIVADDLNECLTQLKDEINGAYLINDKEIIEVLEEIIKFLRENEVKSNKSTVKKKFFSEKIVQLTVACWEEMGGIASRPVRKEANGMKKAMNGFSLFVELVKWRVELLCDEFGDDDIKGFDHSLTQLINARENKS
jgi:hypothetical protein